MGNKIQVKDKPEIYINFLQKTKDGKYAKIEESSLEYSRLEFETESTSSNEEDYFYSIS